MKKRNEQQKSSRIIDTHQKTILEINMLIQDKVLQLQKIIQNTVLSINTYKKYEIFSNSDVILCITTLTELYDKTVEILNKVKNIPGVKIEDMTNPNLSHSEIITEINGVLDQLQQFTDKLSIIICGFGTLYLEDLLFIGFGSEFMSLKTENKLWESKYELLLKYLRPIGYKTYHWKNKTKPKDAFITIPISDSSSNICCNKITDDTIHVELGNQFECFDVDNNAKSVYVKIYGLSLTIHSERTQKTIVVRCLVDNIVVDCLTNAFVTHQKDSYLTNLSKNDTVDLSIAQRMVNTFTLKDFLVWGSADVMKKYVSVMTEVNSLKNTKLDVTIKKFLEMDICSQRQMLINLLVYNKEDDVQYITYLLYDLVTTSPQSNSGGDSLEQMLIYESFPWKIKLYFKETMKNTIKYTKDIIHKYDINRVTLEQQIYVMKAPENIKERAIAKLKEIKGKSDDSGNKAKQYLEGLLRIPFGVYREEPILKKLKNINQGFQNILVKKSPLLNNIVFNQKEKYTTIEMLQYINNVQEYVKNALPQEIRTRCASLNNKQINVIVGYINNTYKSHNSTKHILTSKTKEEKMNAIFDFLDELKGGAFEVQGIPKKLDYYSQLHDYSSQTLTDGNGYTLYKTVQELEKTKSSICEIRGNISEINDILDDSIHGHEYAKNQILKIIGQWMNGEQSGYCFGFEGSPGIGKTSLAKKGLAYCLKDGASPRPFAFIALGGSCNGSTLEGHSYTYVNSTWGRIADILMETKCMNPIIYIDELDKVSKTEHGKEIIGILTHLIDTTQNDVFQDKYFSGIELDLSKALFIFSYNDPSQIDRILLDRIHRIKFDNLSIDEKIVIVRKYILPEINKKMGLVDAIELSDEMIEYLINNYTFEPGVRKLKELLFDLFGEINLEIMNCNDASKINLPIIVKEEDIGVLYMKKYDRVSEKKIHESPEVGVINGLWASTYGKGGIIPIQTMFFPSGTFLELKLTGMQGDVMKESMNVAKSLAWKLLGEKEQESLVSRFEKTKYQGLHIHCPEGAVSKDGPSAGTAITLAILSLLKNKKINHNVAITGEITLQGNVTEIGGLENKILGGIRAGINVFLFPKSNEKDFKKFMEKYGNKKNMKDIQFISVSTIQETFPYVFME
jgi:ATP-dependent Lon protease